MAEANFLLNIRNKLNFTDQQRIKGIETIGAKIKCLQDKYYAKTYRKSSRLVTKFTTWKMDKSIPPSENYIALHMIREEAHRITESTGTKFLDDYMWNTFIWGLLPEDAYTYITDGFLTSTATVDEKLTLLDEKWEVMKSRRKEQGFISTELYKEREAHRAREPELDEEAFMAYGKKMGFLQDDGEPRGCFKCGSGKHIGRECPFARKIFERAKQVRIAAEGEESDEDTRTFENITRVRGASRSPVGIRGFSHSKSPDY